MHFSRIALASVLVALQGFPVSAQVVQPRPQPQIRIQGQRPGHVLQPSSVQPPNQPPASSKGLEQIEHIVVIYLENHSYDNLYGLFPKSEGVSSAGDSSIQVNATGIPYQTLPQVVDSRQTPPLPDARFPVDLPNQPFNLSRYVKNDEYTPDMLHRFYQEQAEIDGGLMDKYVLYSGAGALPMGYYDGAALPMTRYAEDYVLGDHMFHAAFGGSFLNHFWLVCACTPVFPKAPSALVAEVDARGGLVKDGAVTSDGYAVNTLFPAASPSFSGKAVPANLLPAQAMPTIGDRLNDKNISWAWYAGGYNDAVAGHPDNLFEVHHQPFLYFANYAQGSKGAADHLKDETDLLKAIDTDTLPAVSFWKPIGEDDEHPGYASVLKGDTHVASLIKRIHDSPAWASTVIIVTYDENGGEWDHVPPPKGDRWGPGTRVPLIVVSPLAKQKFVDHAVYDTTSILRLIEIRYGLAPLGDRDARANPMLNALSIGSSPVKY